MRNLQAAIFVLIPAALGVIHNLDSHSKSEHIEPISVGISNQKDLRELAEDALGPDFFSYRDERDAGSGRGQHIGTTFRLDGTRRHYFALVHWTGHPSHVVFIVTMTRRNNPTDSCLWRSTDYGRTFSNDTYKLNDTRVVIQWYYVSPNRINLVFADIRQNKIYVTRNNGETFESYQLQFTPNLIRFQSRFIVNNDEEDLQNLILGYDRKKQELHVSKNLGMSWIQIGNNVSRFTWRYLNETYENKSAVYFESAVNETHADLRVTQSPFEESLMFDENLGPIAINSTILSYEFMFVKKPRNWTTDRSSFLWVSTYRKPFQQARFPLEWEEKYYAIMDASEHQVFLAVYYPHNRITNLYISDVNGVEYSYSLGDIVGPSSPQEWEPGNNPRFDIHAVDGVPGTYLVNRFLRPEGDVNDNQEIPTSTVISYDKGAEWMPLNPPATHKDNTPILCQMPSCSLHLRMDTDSASGYTSVLSQDSALGLIMAQGNVGSNLEASNSLLYVYLSRDGGFTWQEIQQGHWSFQMISSGSILVMIPKRATVDPVDFVEWSCDEGVTWTRYIFTLEPVRFVGMLPERGEKSRHITVFGYIPNQEFAWLISDLNFTEAVPLQCSEDKDYIEWIPTDGRPDSRCILGIKKTFKRRKTNACCFVDPEYERPINESRCSCVHQDYACAFGFERNTLDGPCVPMNGTIWLTPPPEDCPEEGTYSFTSGYRKVVGNKCEEEKVYTPYDPIVQNCPVVPPTSLSLKITGVDDWNAIQVGQVLTFTLSQGKGWTMSTEYTWNFDDNTTFIGKGLKNYYIQTHAYDRNGTYKVKVKARNSAGESEICSVIFIATNKSNDKPDQPDGNNKPNETTGNDKPDQPNGNNKPNETTGNDKPDQPDNKPNETNKAASSNADSNDDNTSLEVGLSLSIILIGVIIIFFVIIILVVWIYHRKFTYLRGKYSNFLPQPGNEALPMTLTRSELQDDIGDSDKKALVFNEYDEI